MSSPADVGIFTTDASLAVTAWDDWMVAATGIARERALGQPVPALFPEIEARGLLRCFHDALTGQVHVLAPAFHHYLIKCPTTAPSARFAEMQQRATIGPLRQNDAVVGVIVAIEDVTARLEAERSLAQMLAEGRGVTDENWRVRQAAVRALSDAGDRDLAFSLVATLRDAHRNFGFLSSALSLLAATNVNVTGPLSQLLKDPDRDLRIQAALALGDRSDPAAIPPLIAALSDEDTNVRFQAIESLGRLRATAAVDDLLTIVESRDFFLAFAALDALALIGNAAVGRRLVPLLAVTELRTAVADALAATGDITVVAPLVGALNRSPEATVSIAGALSQIYDRSEREFRDGVRIADAVRAAIDARGERHVVNAVPTAATDQLPGLVRVLSWLQSPDVARTLTRLLGEPVVRNDVVEALARHGDGVVEALTDQLRSEDPEIRHAAVVALGRVGSKRATPALVALLDQERDLLIAVAGALARIADRAAFQPLLSLLRHHDGSVRQSAVGALNSIGHPEMSRCVMALLEDDDPLVRESAVRIAGYFGYADTADRLFACLDDPSDIVRRAAIEHLPYLDDDRVLAALGAALRDEEPAGRSAAARALGRVDDPRAGEMLSGALADPNHWVRYYAARGLAEQAHAPSIDALLDLAERDPAPQVRIAALNAVGSIGDTGALPRLEPLSGDSNDQISVAALEAIGRIADMQGLPALQAAIRAEDPQRRAAAAAALASHGSTDAVRLLEWAAAGDPDDAVARGAIAGLARVGSAESEGAQSAIDALITLLSDSAKRDRTAAALATLPPSRIAAVARGLRHPHPDVRKATVDALGRFQREEATRFIEEALIDTAESVREAAVGALARLGVRGMRERVTRLAVEDPSKTVRRAATTALAQLQA